MDEVNTLMLSQIKEIDQLDDNQILAELAGETVKDFIYEVVDKKGKRTVKLSWVGTRQAAMDRGNITLSDPMITDNNGYIRIVVRGTDLKRNVSLFGGCHQPKQIKVNDKNGEYHLEDDPYYFTKALSKAQRNVIQSVLPATFLARMVDKFLAASGKPPTKQLSKGRESKPRLADALPELKPEDVTTLYALEVTAFNRWHIQPKEVYQQLGYASKNECSEKPWDCFLKLQAIYENSR